MVVRTVRAMLITGPDRLAQCSLNRPTVTPPSDDRGVAQIQLLTPFLDALEFALVAHKVCGSTIAHLLSLVGPTAIAGEIAQIVVDSIE
jgi:hypothetical protein